MTHDDKAPDADQPPQQYVVMRLSTWAAYRFVRNVWWSGTRLSLQQAIQRVDRTLCVYTVAEADRLFPNVGSFARRRQHDAR